MPLLLLSCLLALASPTFAQTDALDSALALIGETRAGFRVDAEVMMNRSGSALKLAMFDQWFSNPLRIPFYERHLRNTLLESEGKLHPLWVTASGAIGVGTRRDILPPTPVLKTFARANTYETLADAIHVLDPKARVPSSDGVPVPVIRATKAILLACADAIEWREQALRNVPASERPGLYALLTAFLEDDESDTLPENSNKALPSDFGEFYSQIDLLTQIDFPLLSAATDDITAVLDSVMADLAANPVLDTFSFRCKTKWGTIILSGADDDAHEETRHPLLILDTGGDDAYTCGAATGGPNHPLGIILDVAGNDAYEADTSAPCFGAGVLGIGILVDAEGDDAYSTPGCCSQGAGLAGCGLLRDVSGDDSYEAIGSAQGYGFFGVGILSDSEGDDSYECYVTSQGCGMTRGLGLLMDLAGDDSYEANDTDIRYPASQTKEHNSSMCQGAGYGLRRDFVDGHSLAGGVGMLLDAEGDDSYFGGVFSQAVGYWYAIGILDDRAGNDSYRDVWYGQSATAHMGVSYFTEGGGNDTYTSLMTMSTGAAHDFSASLFVDEGGDDVYTMKANALGRSLNCSVALFADLAGNDRYDAQSGLGESVNFSSTGLRAEVRTAAVFLDLGGNDIYPADSSVTMGNNRHWLWHSDSSLPLLKGVGLDGSSLTVTFR